MNPVSLNLPAAGDSTLVRAQKLAAAIATLEAGINTLVQAAAAAPGATNLPPVAAFSISASTSPTVSVDGSASVDKDGTIASYAWTFGDGGTATGPRATHTYTAASTYTITLTVTDNVGATGSATKTTTVSAATSQWSTLFTPGDSLTSGQDGGGTTWPGQVGTLLGCTVVNPARPGWTSVDMAVKVGAIDPQLTFPSNTIPASGTATLTAISPSTGYRMAAGISQSYTGVIAGVAGTLTHVANTATWTFARTTTGAAVVLNGATGFHCTEYDSAVGQGYALAIMLGRNDINYTGYLTTIQNSIDAILARFQPSTFLIIGTIADPDSIFSGDKTNHVAPLDAALKARYGAGHFMSAQTYLASTAALTAVGLSPAGSDSSQIAAGDVPDSLSATSDRPHLNANGYLSLGDAVANVLKPLGGQPTGAGITRYQDITASGSIGAKLRTVTQAVSFPAGTFQFVDFADAYGGGYNGADVSTITALYGSGSKATTFQVQTDTSTKASQVPPTGTIQINTLEIRNRANFTAQGFTVGWTDQGHLYNGLRLQGCSAPTLTDVRAVGFVGSSQSPPGETFGVNLYSITGGATIVNSEGDGAGVAASIWALNSFAGGLTINGLYVHDTLGTGHSAAQGACKGLALWQTSGGATVHGFKGRNNWADLGFERCTGTYNFYDPDLGGSKLFGHLGNDNYSAPCKINFYFTSAAAMPAHIDFWCPATYRGVSNTQSVANDVKVYLNGVLQSGIARSVAYPA